MSTASLFGPVVEDVPKVEERLRQLSRGHHSLLSEALEYVFDAPGKRIRAAVALLSGKLGRYDLDRLVTLATCLEVVHSATLAHDDTLDHALTRRGLDTVNSVWNGHVAILVGDFLFAQSADLAAQLNSIRIITLFSETVMAMSSAELLQYTSSQTRTTDEADYFHRIAGKTASLFAAASEGAAIVTNQTEEQIAALRVYGMNLGLAFQMADDVLDFTADAETLGKPSGSDLREGTITLPVILLAQRLPKHSPVLSALKEGKELGCVIEAVRDSRAPADALQRAEEYAKVARSSLSIFSDSDTKDTLLELTEHVVHRQR